MPKPAKRRSKRQTILDAARSAFVERGYAATSMDLISARAGVSKRTVYNHFGSKEALFEAAVLEFHDAHNHEGFAAIDPDAPLEQQLLMMATARIHGLLEPETMAFLRMLIGEFMRSPELARDLGKRLKDPAHDPLIPLFALASQRSGVVAEPERLAEHFWSLMFGLIFWPQVVMHEEQSPAELERRTVEAVGHFLVAHPDIR